MPDWKEQTCCIVGHRLIPKWQHEVVSARTEFAIRDLIMKKGIRYFGVDGSWGFDTLAANILFRLRQSEQQQIRVILVYPYEGFTSQWSGEQQEEYCRLLPMYDKVVCIDVGPSREAYLKRDRHLVDNSSCCLCYCTQRSGGTAYAVDYAKHKGLSIWNIGDMIDDIR